MSITSEASTTHVICYDMSKGALALLYTDNKRASGLPMHIVNGKA